MQPVTETAAPAAATGKKGKKDMSELKKEMVMDEHQITVEALAKRFNTDISKDFTVVRCGRCLAAPRPPRTSRRRLLPPVSHTFAHPLRGHVGLANAGSLSTPGSIVLVHVDLV